MASSGLIPQQTLALMQTTVTIYAAGARDRTGEYAEGASRTAASYQHPRQRLVPSADGTRIMTTLDVYLDDVDVTVNDKVNVEGDASNVRRTVGGQDTYYDEDGNALYQVLHVV